MEVRQAEEIVRRCWPKVARAIQPTGEPREARLTPRQLRLLSRLDSDRAIGVGELSSALSVTPSTVSISVKKLARKGLLSIRRDSKDGRRVGVRLTPEGESLIASLQALDAGALTALLERLDGEEREAAAYGLWLLSEAASPGKPRL